MNEIPLMLRIEKARNELRFSVNQIAAKHDLPGYLIDLIIGGVLSEELQQRVSMMAEQIDVTEAAGESEVETDGD